MSIRTWFLWIVVLALPQVLRAAEGAFVHPGLLHTAADLERMRTRVEQGQSPWIDSWNLLIASRHANLDWRPRPLETVVRGGQGQNFPQLFNDIAAAYAHALQWKVTGDARHADKAIEILDAWSGALKEIRGNADRFLAAGIYGYQFANAAEIMRTYERWPRARLKRFQDMMVNVFYPMNRHFLDKHNDAYITNYWANWDLCNMASILSIGVLCDRRDLYNEAIEYFKHGAGNGSIMNSVYYVHPGNLGQFQESGRDQGHATLCIALMASLCEMAWNQGDDLYGYDNNRFLAGAEYIARYNLFLDVPYVTYSAGTGRHGSLMVKPDVSPAGRGSLRPGWEMIYNHYVNRKGIAAPYTAATAAKIRPEGGPGGHASSFDQPGFGTLTFTRDPIASATGPTGLTALVSGQQVTLSWWGASGATSYIVKRKAQTSDGFDELATLAADDVMTFTDADVVDGTTYHYVISAKSESGDLPDSNRVVADVGTRLHAHLPMEKTTVRLVRDVTNSGWNGTRQQGNSSGFVSLPAGVVNDLSDFTIAAWVKPDAQQTWARIFDFGSGTGRYMYLTPKAGNGKARFAITITGGFGEQSLEAPAALPVGTWTHIVVTRRGDLGTLYIDGVAVATHDAMFLSPMRMGPTTQNWIGRSQYDNDPTFDGRVRDLRIYRGALPAQEIVALVDATRP